MLKYSSLAVAAALVGSLFMAGCPGTRPDGFLLVIHNDSGDTEILDIAFRGPGEEDFVREELAEPLLPGQRLSFVLDAPLKVENEQGVTWRVQVIYEGDFLDNGVLPGERTDTGTFRCTHAWDRSDWHWTPGSEPDRCIN